MTSKKSDSEVEPEVKEAFDAWLAAQGGKEQLVARMRSEKVAKLITGSAPGTKLGELDEKAKSENLLDGLKELTLGQLKGILAPEPVAPPNRKRGRPPGRPATRRARPAGGERGQATTAILKYVGGHPDCKNSDIAKATGLDAAKTTQQLTYIRKNNWVATKGKLRGMTYRISAEGKRRLAG